MKVRLKEAFDDVDNLNDFKNGNGDEEAAKNTIIEDVKVGDTFNFETDGYAFNVSVTGDNGLTIYVDEQYYVDVMGTTAIGVNLSADIVLFVIYPDDTYSGDPIADWWEYGLSVNSIYDLCKSIATVLDRH